MQHLGTLMPRPLVGRSCLSQIEEVPPAVGRGGTSILVFLYWTINQKKDSELPRAGHIMALWRNFFANLPLTLKSP
jgi:hypothetical protein